MADNIPAYNLTVVSQIYNQQDDANAVTFRWERGYSIPNENIIGNQFVDVTLFDLDFTCGEPARICFDAGPNVSEVTIRGIGFNTLHKWRVNTNFILMDGREGTEWVESSIQTFTSASRGIVVPNPPPPITPPATGGNARYKPLLPALPGYSAILPGNTTPGAPPPAPSLITGDPLPVARLATYYWSRENSIIMVAIAGAESSWTSNAQGDNVANFSGATPTEIARACNGYWSQGLYQINMNAHYPRLEYYVGVGSTPCDWATWLHNPNNNTQMAYEIQTGRGNFSDWTVYNNGSYQAFLSQATAAVDQSIAEWGG